MDSSSSTSLKLSFPILIGAFERTHQRSQTYSLVFHYHHTFVKSEFSFVKSLFGVLFFKLSHNAIHSLLIYFSPPLSTRCIILLFSIRAS
ncbi:uncharacterized protein DS421_10g310490 [Arachis hypogaea]|nr:uncharacterized protein DS421_10g310490 [Arachis hypogaea]